MIKCSIGIMAHNEKENIPSLLDSILAQKLYFCLVHDIIVVSSGSSDGTDEVVGSFSVKDPRIRLITQQERLGKASAINLFLREAKEEVCILVNSDSVLDTDAIEFLTRPLSGVKTGMTGGRAIPIVRSKRPMAMVNDFMWGLHHEISLLSPKMGELVAFRKELVREIAGDTAVDEVYIEWKVKNSGCGIVYVPESKVYIRTPDTAGDFVLQRRRIAAGHCWAGRILKYSPSTSDKWLTLRLTCGSLARNPGKGLFIFAAAFLECLSRILGWYDYYILQRNPYIWKICLSTKGKPIF